MTDFPTIVYRCPGVNAGFEGTTYSSVGVLTTEQLEERLREGYHRTMPEAVAAYKARKTATPFIVQEVEDEDDLDAPATREELLQQAEEIGLKVDGRWSDKKLLQKIQERMG